MVPLFKSSVVLPSKLIFLKNEPSPLILHEISSLQIVFPPVIIVKIGASLTSIHSRLPLISVDRNVLSIFDDGYGGK